jgi:hypothetical protein
MYDTHLATTRLRVYPSIAQQVKVGGQNVRVQLEIHSSLGINQ